jgi:2-methylisocitrate lyase-like PEP mutase family enzyme
VLFVEAPQDEAEIAAVARAFPDVPLLFNWAEGGKTPPVTYDRLRELGFRIIIFPISTLLAATRAIREVLAAIRGDGTPAGVLSGLPGFAEFTDFIGLPEVVGLEARYAADEQRAAAPTEEKGP